MLPEWSDPDRRDAALRRVARDVATPNPLTTNELAIVFLKSHGVPQRQIAAWLHLSPHTVADYAKQANLKLGAGTTTHAVASALRLGLIS